MHALKSHFTAHINLMCILGGNIKNFKLQVFSLVNEPVVKILVETKVLVVPLDNI